MEHLGVIAVALYIIIVATLFFISKGRFSEQMKKGFGVSNAVWRRKDTKVAYFRFIGFLGGLLTLVLMLIFKYGILGL
ncbi:MAG TPA: hypothetical protein VM935_03900 [Chitinophagaceae bacterium]|jgi:hypothetical protein|nr:hypothetical protein [Chitinophagaceae bacterium]